MTAIIRSFQLLLERIVWLQIWHRRGLLFLMHHRLPGPAKGSGGRMREDANYGGSRTGRAALHPMGHIVVVFDEQHFSLGPRRPYLVGPLLGHLLWCGHQHG